MVDGCWMHGRWTVERGMMDCGWGWMDSGWLMDGCWMADEWMDGWIGGWMDEWMGGVDGGGGRHGGGSRGLEEAGAVMVVVVVFNSLSVCSSSTRLVKLSMSSGF